MKSILLGGVTPDEQTERAAWFVREIETLSTLRHPSICDIRDVIAEGGMQYLVLELIEGRTLADDVVTRGSPGLPADEVFAWTAALCEALTYLHRRTPPVIFRDLKPQNVMVRRDGRIALIDFGIARGMVGGGGTAIGTAGYAAPEQYQGLAEPRSDVYALAAVLHHLLTGRDPTMHPPFTFPAVRSLIPTLSVHVEAALQSALSMRIEDRPSSAQAFADALRGAIPFRSANLHSAPPQPLALPAPKPLEHLDALIAPARASCTTLPHILLVDALIPGAQQRCIAQALAIELGVELHPIEARGLRQPADLVAALTATKPRDVVYIDDVGAMPPSLRATLKEALVDQAVGSTGPIRAHLIGVDGYTIAGGIAVKDLALDLATLFAEWIDTTTLTATWKTRIEILPDLSSGITKPTARSTPSPIPASPRSIPMLFPDRASALGTGLRAHFRTLA